MPSTYTNLGIQKMATGEKAGTWGTLTNTNWDMIENIAGGYVAQALTDNGTVTLTKSDGSESVLGTRVIKLTGTLSVGNAIVTVPDSIENWWIVNNAEGGSTYTVTFKTVSGTGVEWAAGVTGAKLIYTDGTNCIDASASFGDVTLTGTQTLTNKTLTAPKIVDGGFIADGGGDENLVFGEVGTPVNELKITNAATGSGPILSAVSTSATDANIPINITPKGTGDVFINPPTSGSLIVSGSSTQAGKIVLQADTDDTGSFVASFQPGVLTESTAYILPLADAGTSGDALTSNASGTLSWTTISGGTSWQAVETGTSMTAVAGNGYFIDTTSNVCNVTLPTGVLGEEVVLLDYAGTFDSNALTVTPASGEKIQGESADTTLTSAVERSAFTLVYSGASQGWLLKDK